MKKAAGGRTTFTKDPQLTALNVPQVNPMNNSVGYGDLWNRGHMAPSKAMSWDQAPLGPWKQCYYTTNIAPQAGMFNQQGWRILEERVFNWVLNRTQLYVVTGVFYQNAKINYLPGGVGIPDYYYKIICDGTHSAAFMGKNLQGTPGNDSLQYKTVKSVQDLTNIDFRFPASCNINTVNPSHWWN